MGLFLGQGVQTGDGTGGNVEVAFRPQNPTDTPTLADQRLQYIYFVDGVQMSANQDPGNAFARIVLHMARANVAIAPPFQHLQAFDMIDDGLAFSPTRPPIADHWTRTPVFWDPQELLSGNNNIVQLGYENNVNLAAYTSAVFGRYYGRQVLGNRAFGRLISPAAISQF